MTYLHDFLSARQTLRDKTIPMLIAALMPTLDKLGVEYVTMYEYRPTTKEKVDGLRVSGPELGLPHGYVLRIDFYPTTMPNQVSAETKTEPGF